ATLRQRDVRLRCEWRAREGHQAGGDPQIYFGQLVRPAAGEDVWSISRQPTHRIDKVVRIATCSACGNQAIRARIRVPGADSKAIRRALIQANEEAIVFVKESGSVRGQEALSCGAAQTREDRQRIAIGQRDDLRAVRSADVGLADLVLAALVDVSDIQ